ncbi:hypothetical protein QCD79_32585, partial [Pseudomonas quasicaspiana]|nr:hypothetical protein [Pseudomonas quasicaspiana]
NVGVGCAENMMSGYVRVKGSASQAAGATAHGGLLVIDGNAAARSGITFNDQQAAVSRGACSLGRAAFDPHVTG